MTDPNNSNDEHDRPTQDGAGHDDDALWSDFERDHAHDLDDIARSREAKRFEHHAKRQEKKALLSVNDLDNGAFTDDAAHAGAGPRDFTGSSWLDTDDVMDRFGDDFVPPNPTIGHVKTTTLVFWILLVVGVLGVILSTLVPSWTGLLGTVFGTCALLGGAGLIIGHRGHTQTRTDYSDDGSRV
ncbi:MAG: hypothetical protein SOI13_04820 [Bifidobacterium mongoliense]|jgi:hypothetical protein|nr:hypothetical protein [Bifidobacterium mongoliense]MDN5632639.1 hypothetical protein [Bifidobacterium mongoliense]MDN5979084.1 hypothetical protein [Bifidobacterium mongoliense]MDN6017039.1 hypothetical protein [Bifidobacterium mongoliense]MDN6485083.1 hypothetical protein [Bifidobacterium mongoliense]MDN6553616.1 hypothetical protein [Bifidobacterium mongoliense]